VQPGETLYRISRLYGVPLEEILAANPSVEPTQLKVGDRLFIPGAKQRQPRTEVAGEEPGPKRHSLDLSAFPEPEPLPQPKQIERGNARLAWPLVGVLYARFGKRGETNHEGIDLAAPEGTPVLAAGDGRVIFSGPQRGYGNLVIIEHGGGLLTLYAYNKENLVKEGDQVREGTPIAKVGSGTRTSGPHMHFEVRDGQTPRDPLEYLPPPR
jgi:murein DD-endopeptidase MepM/ murein hydrolase activator NlpD